jgi:hypothetical protein
MLNGAGDCRQRRIVLEPKKKQLDRNLQDKQDDAIDRRREFIRTRSPE